MKRSVPPSSSRLPENLGFSFQEDLWFGDFDDEAARQAAANSMAAMAGRIMGARPFPAAAQRLVQLTRNENTNIMKVVRVLESDPGLSQRVLRLVNSAGYGLRVRCTSLNHATALLGQQRLQQIATSAVLLNHFGRTSEETKRKQEHGALVASLCRYLAIHLGLPQEDLFTCGLLHDLGQLMMLDEGQPGYKELVVEREHDWDTLHIAEREMMGFDHAVLAAHVLASWSIPSPVPEVISLHHQPALAHQGDPKISAMVQTLRFADHMSHLLETSDAKEGASRLADSEAASYLGFSEMQIAAMWEDLRQLHQANLNRRMDIQDIAPRSLNVPASLSPRAQSITETGTFSQSPVSLSKSAPSFSELPDEGLGPEASPPSLIPTGRSLPPHFGDSHAETPRSWNQGQKPGLSTEESDGDDRNSDNRDSDVRASDKHDSDRPSDYGAQPEVFPCAICYGPTFGAKCPVCTAHVCSAHQTSARQWCMACEDEFQHYVLNFQLPVLLKIAAIAAVSVAVASSLIFGGLEMAFGVLGMAITAALGAYAGYQGYLKARFKRQRTPVESPPTQASSGLESYAGLPRELTDRIKRDRARGDAKEGGQPEQEVGEGSATRTLSMGSFPLSKPPSSQPTIPSPSEGEAARASSHARSVSEPPQASQFSWPPSQEAPVSAPRISMLPTLGQQAPEIRFTDGDPNSSAEEQAPREEFETADRPEPSNWEDEVVASRPMVSSSVAAAFPDDEPSSVGTEFEPPVSTPTSRLSSVHPEAEEQVPSALRKSRAPENAQPDDSPALEESDAEEPFESDESDESDAEDSLESEQSDAEDSLDTEQSDAEDSRDTKHSNTQDDAEQGGRARPLLDRQEPEDTVEALDNSSPHPAIMPPAVDATPESVDEEAPSLQPLPLETANDGQLSLDFTAPPKQKETASVDEGEVTPPSPRSTKQPISAPLASTLESIGPDGEVETPQNQEELATTACAAPPSAATVVIVPPVFEPPKDCSAPPVGLVSINTRTLENLGPQVSENDQNRKASGGQ